MTEESTVLSVSQKLRKSLRLLADALREWWRVPPSYQQRGRSLAVRGYVFALINLFALGLLPPLSFLGIVCSLAAIHKGNRAWISVLGVLLGAAGVVLSIHVLHTLQFYAIDGAALKAMLEGMMSSVQETVARLTG